MDDRYIIDAEWVDITEDYNREQERQSEIKKSNLMNKVNHICKVIMIVCGLGICINMFMFISNELEMKELVKETRLNSSYYHFN